MKFIFLLIFVLFSNFVVAESIAVSPSKIHLKDEKSLFLINPNEKEVSYSIVYDLPEWINLSLSEGKIKANGVERIKISLSPFHIKPGNYSYSLFVYYDKEMTLVSGVQVEINIFIPKERFGFIPQWSKKAKFIGLLTTVFIVLFGIILMLILK